MAKLDLRVRLLSKLLGAFSVATLSEEQIRRLQRRSVGHNPVTDLLIGARARGVDVRDDTAASGAGRVPVRVYRPSAATGELPLVIMIHGGGWVFGNLDVFD